jgi:hypothetical protein
VLLEDFEDGLDEYGTDLNDWPDGLRVAALALLERSSEARQFFEDEKRLDAALLASATRPVTAPVGMADRIVLKAIKTSPAPSPILAAPAPRVRASMLERSALWIRTQFSDPGLRYAVILLFCFSGGVAASQVFAGGQADANPAYVSGFYADLAY